MQLPHFIWCLPDMLIHKFISKAMFMLVISNSHFLKNRVKTKL